MTDTDSNQIVGNSSKKEIVTEDEKRQLSSSPFKTNLAEELLRNYPEEIKTMGHVVVDDFKNDKESRSGWDSRATDWNKLYHGLKEVKNTPFENASNVKLPILSTACLQFHARAYDQILPSKEIVKCWATDGISVKQAERAQKYMNYQLTDKMDEWVEEQDMLLLILPLYGSCVKKTYYDPMLKRPVSQTLRASEFVAPYGVNRLEDAPRKTHIYEMHLNDIKLKGKAGIWINLEGVEDKIPGVQEDVPAGEAKKVAEEATGTEPSSDQKDTPRQILEQHRTWDLDGDGIGEWYVITVDKETEQVLRIDSLEYDDPLTGETKVYDYFTSYSFIPNPESWMGLGFGHTLEHLNESANSIMNQLIDSGKLANTISGFFNTRSGLEDGDVEFVMGQFNGLEMSVDDINKAIYQFKFNPPSQVLFALLEKVHSYAQELSSVTNTMMGKLPPSDTTATTILTMMEQGLKMFSTIAQRIFRSEKKEFKKIMLLNALFIDDEEYVMVQDSRSSDMVGFTLAKDDFRNYIDVMPIADPNITSRAEKLIKAQQAYQVVINDPELRSDAMLKYEVTLRYFEALEIKNIDQILKKPEPQEPPDLTPVQEEAEFLAERYVNPLPIQDHGAHLESHREFEQSDMAQQLTPQGKKLLETHIKETLAMFYIQMKESEEEVRNAEANERGPAGMVEPSMYRGGAGDVGGGGSQGVTQPG